MSFYDMIPDNPLVMPAGAHAAKADRKKMFGLREKTCAYCGEKYYRRIGEQEYIRYKNNKELHFCSWTHTCRWEEENPKGKKAAQKGRKRKPAQERIDKMMRDMVKVRAKLDSEEGRAMSAHERNKLRSGLGWRAHEIKKLTEEEEIENSGSM